MSSLWYLHRELDYFLFFLANFISFLTLFFLLFLFEGLLLFLTTFFSTFFFVIFIKGLGEGVP